MAPLKVKEEALNQSQTYKSKTAGVVNVLKKQTLPHTARILRDPHGGHIPNTSEN